MNKKFRQRGLVTVIFILLMALIATFILIIGQSRLMLSLQRGKSTSDTLITTYQAESDINNLLLRLARGYLKNSDFDFKETKQLDGGALTLDIEGKLEGTNQILTVTAKRTFAVSKIQAVRAVTTASQIEEVDLMLMLDCTGSMGDPASSTSSTTIMEEQRMAAINFINNMQADLNGDFFNVGVGVFGIDAAWLKTRNGVDIKPNANISYSEIVQALEARFGRNRNASTACPQVMDGTSVGSGFTFAQDYFAANTNANKKIEVLITDGRPNSRIPYPNCPPSIFCSAVSQNCANNKYGWTCAPTCTGSSGRDFLRCAITDTTKGGVRNPNIDAYAVTVFDKPEPDIVPILTQNTTQYFPATDATKLTDILNSIFEQVITSTSKTTVSRLIPLEEN